MSWKPFVRSEHSVFESPLAFESFDDAMTSAEDKASRLKAHYLKIVEVIAVESTEEPNHVLRDGVLVRIGWSTTKR